MHKDIEVREIYLPVDKVFRGIEDFHAEPDVACFQFPCRKKVAPAWRGVGLGRRYAENALEVGGAFRKGVWFRHKEEGCVFHLGVTQVCSGAAEKAPDGELCAEGAYKGNSIGPGSLGTAVRDQNVVKGDGFKGTHAHHLVADVGVNLVPDTLYHLPAHPGLNGGGLDGCKKCQGHKEESCQNLEEYARNFFHCSRNRPFLKRGPRQGECVRRPCTGTIRRRLSLRRCPW